MLVGNLQTWQRANNRRLLSTSIEKDGHAYCCIALANPGCLIRLASPVGNEKWTCSVGHLCDEDGTVVVWRGLRCAFSGVLGVLAGALPLRRPDGGSSRPCPQAAHVLPLVPLRAGAGSGAGATRPLLLFGLSTCMDQRATRSRPPARWWPGLLGRI